MKSVILATCLILAMSTLSFADATQNVLVVSIDTLRADHVGIYGYKQAKTPAIDSLAARGVVFKDTVSPAPFTLPSHISLLTGLIPPIHGVQDNGGFYLKSNVTTLAEIFKAQGYNTGAFVGAFPLDSRFGLNQGFDVYDDSYPTRNNVNEMTMPERKADSVADSALAWLEKQKNSTWFAWAHFYDPHFPYQSPESFSKMFPQNPYDAEVAFTDSQLARILDFLKKTGQFEKTLIIITADHGESLGEHKEETHGIFCYESTLRVPLIISPFKPATVDTRVRLIDVFPTILELKKIKSAGKTQGTSLVKYLEGQQGGSPQDSYFEALSMYFNAQWAPVRGFYSKNFKYIDLPIPELYDLNKDPTEQQNLCSDSALCKTWAGRFQVNYKDFLKPPSPPGEVDRETIEQLKALGYVSGSWTPAKDKQFTEKEDPKNLISFHNRVDSAIGFYKRGYDLKALEILERIMDEKPDYSVAYMHASFIRSAGGFPDKAIEILKNAIKNGIVNSEIQGKLGIYLYEADRFDEAIQQLNLAIKEDPENLDNLNYLGMSYTGAGIYAEAEKTFRKALQIDATDGMTLTNLGTLFLTQKKYDQAIMQLSAAIASNPSLANAHNGLGVAYASQKNWPKAIEAWRTALNENDQNYDAMLNLAYAYLEIQDKTNA
ncbi:MAG TPA: sulfatase-like hydrolase/transferase, partial [Acidobacteriota bacterium]|nr:sulfatase-like hydrolase/transferase [Acidobacteriota bacterium]